ncbi:SpoIIE family protein phosphatase [Streptomyces tricolor]|nr:SpoIIE family protein phosphatase [Streptomyces tricolor]
MLISGTADDRGAHRERAERAARTTALEGLAERLTLVADITEVLGQTLELDEALARLSRLLVPRFADWAAVDLRIGSRQVHRVAVTRSRGPRRRAGGLARSPSGPGRRAARSALVQVLNGGGPVVQDRAGPDDTPPDSPLAAVHDAFLEATGAVSVITVPLGTGRQVSGALTLVRTDPDRPFGTGDLEVASDIGRRVGLVVDNARRYGRQREVAEAMQRNLLPPLPEHGRVRLAAGYQPAPAGSQVGGDWYDAFTLRDGTLALVIGDVVGHDLTAAAGMAQLHGILRSLAWDHTGPTGAVVDRLDDAMHAITTVSMATLVLARLEGPPDTGPWTLHWTSAGHPPPLLLTADGTAQYLEAGQGLLLGTRLGARGRRPSAAHALPPGSTLLLYTDGLIESPGSDLDTGLGRLRRHALALAHEPLDILCDRLPRPDASRQHRRHRPPRPAPARDLNGGVRGRRRSRSRSQHQHTAGAGRYGRERGVPGAPPPPGPQRLDGAVVPGADQRDAECRAVIGEQPALEAPGEVPGTVLVLPAHAGRDDDAGDDEEPPGGDAAEQTAPDAPPRRPPTTDRRRPRESRRRTRSGPWSPRSAARIPGGAHRPRDAAERPRAPRSTPTGRRRRPPRTGRPAPSGGRRPGRATAGAGVPPPGARIPARASAGPRCGCAARSARGGPGGSVAWVASPGTGARSWGGPLPRERKRAAPGVVGRRGRHRCRGRCAACPRSLHRTPGRPGHADGGRGKTGPAGAEIPAVTGRG